MSEQVMTSAKPRSSPIRNSSVLQRAAITPVAHRVLQRCSNGVECPACRAKREQRERQEGTLQRAAVNTASTPAVPPIVHDVLNSPGQPLDRETRAFMEPRFGHDFSGVRLHTDAKAAESTRAVNALAYTVGKDVVFGIGQYVPSTVNGRKLLAHELTHVVQQSAQRVSLSSNVDGGDSDPLEQAADLTAEQIMDSDETKSESIQFGIKPSRIITQGESCGIPLRLQRQQPEESTAQVNTQPPPGSLYVTLPAGLLTTLARSFNERVQGLPNSQHNLDNGFCWGSCKPATLWEALDKFGVADINSLAEVYERAGGAWKYVHSIQNVWTGSSRGFLFTCEDPANFIQYINGSGNLCKDSSIGQSEHQKPKPKECWREVISGSYGLHICLDKGGSVMDNELHIDLHQTVRERDAKDGSCTYNMNPFGDWGRHIWDVKVSYDKSIFELFQDNLNDAYRLRHEFNVSSDKDLDEVDARLKALQPYMRSQAGRGLQGEQQAEREKKDEVQDIDRIITKVFIKVLPPAPVMIGP